jgi:hypothetical protein
MKRAGHGTSTAGVLLAAFSAVVATIGLSIVTIEAASAATTWSAPSQVAIPATSLTGSLSGLSCVDSTDCTAVGVDNYGEPYDITETGGIWGAPAQLAAPTGVASFSAVSCVSSGNCTAVGSVHDQAILTTYPIYAEEHDGTWGSVTEISGSSTNGAGDFTTFSSVSCVDADDCTAVGDTGAMGGNVPIYATETGGAWSGVESFPTNPYGGQLNEGDMTSVSCINASNCTAVGDIAFGRTVPGYVVETNGSWGILTEVVGTPSGYGSLAGVTCASATTCTAVGEDSDNQPIDVTETSGGWGAPVEVSGSPGGSGSFSSVSCADATDCTAVGADGVGQPTYDVETAGAWGPATQLTFLPDVPASFAGVSCTTATACTAVGVDGNGKPIAAAAAGGTWSTPAELSGVGVVTGSLTSVSCVTVGNCTAVGGDGNSQPIYETESSNAWGTPTEVPSGPGSFAGVSCTSIGNCTAVGNDGDSPMYASETSGAWANPLVLQITDSVTGSLAAVSCPSEGNCTAVGSDGDDQPIYVTETNGTWGAVTELTTGGGGAFTGVSCSEPTNCSAVGTNGAQQAIFSTEAAGVWSTPAAATSDTGTIAVKGLSCVSAGNCTAVGYSDGQGGQGPGIYITQTNGSWGAPTTLSVPGSPDFGAFYGISCTDATDCTVVGESNAPEFGTGMPIDVTEYGGVWGTPAALSGTPGDSGNLASVSCVDATDCTAVGFDGNDDPIYTTSSGVVAPTVSSVSPNSGPTTGGTPITITGTGFVAGATVVIAQGNGAGTGVDSATNVTVVSPTEITATTGGGAKAGTWGLFVTTPGGTSAVSSGSDFTYAATSPVTTVGPTSGRHCHHHHWGWFCHSSHHGDRPGGRLWR